ncbi:pheST operon leader peptide PheM [Escherichia coli]
MNAAIFRVFFYFST